MPSASIKYIKLEGLFFLDIIHHAYNINDVIL